MVRHWRGRRAWRHLLVPILFTLVVTACNGGGTPPATPNDGNAAASTARPTSGQSADKISDVFLQLGTIYQTQGVDAARGFATDQGLLTKQDEVRVTLALDSEDPNMVEGTAIAVGRLGGRVTASFINQIEFVMPTQALLDYQKRTNRQSFFRDLADFQHIVSIQRTPVAERASTIADPVALRQAMAAAGTGGKSEGVSVTGADKWQVAGITGKGVKVGIIDGAFNDYKTFLPANRVTTKSFRSDGLLEDPEDEESIHGTACAEIVNEMAPDADLYLATFETPGGFVAAIKWLVGTAGVSVISNSTSWRGDFPLDDSSAPAKAVDSAKAAGVFFATSAGNNASGNIGSDSGGGHYGAVFTDSDHDGWHDFPGAAKQNSLKIRVGPGFYARLNWDDWKKPHVNYDLYLYDESGKEVARSTEDQAKGNRQPVELISGKLAKGDYALKIRKVNPADPDLAMNIVFRGAQFEIVTPEGSLGTPADARGAVAVGALQWKTDVVEDFSSRGPTLDGRKKPEIGAPDDTASFAFASIGEETFPGTSSATPHAAGAAALYKQAFPESTPDATLKFFADHAAKPKGAQAGENITGAGRLFLGPVPQDASANPAPAKGRATPNALPARATAQPAGPRGPEPFTFSDDFSASTSGLPPQGYRNGEYRIAAEGGSLQIAAYPGTGVPGAGTEVYEMQAGRASGASDAIMGLVLRRQDQDNELLFLVTNDGAFGVMAKVDGSLHLLADLGSSTAIRANAANLLRITATGTTFAFEANGTMLARYTIDDVWSAGGYGLLGGGGRRGGAEIAFDNFRASAG